MRVYRPALGWGKRHVNVPSCTVVEPEPVQPQFSGLYDAQGNELMVVEVRQPAGFLTFVNRD